MPAAGPSGRPDDNAGNRPALRPALPPRRARGAGDGRAAGSAPPADDGGGERGAWLRDYWVYVKPVELYGVLKLRQKHQPLFLNRTLAYTAAATARRLRPPTPIHEASLRLSLKPAAGLPPAGVTLVIALLDGGAPPSADGSVVLPRAAWVAQVPARPGGGGSGGGAAAAPASAAAAAAAVEAHTTCVDMTLPPALQRAGEVLVIARADHPDCGAVLGGVGPASSSAPPVRPASARPRRDGRAAFAGLIPAGARVLAARVPIASLSARQPAEVGLHPARAWPVIDPQALLAADAPTDALERALTCVSFSPPLPVGGQASQSEDEADEGEADEEAEEAEEGGGGRVSRRGAAHANGGGTQDPTPADAATAATASAASPPPRLPALTVRLRLGRASRQRAPRPPPPARTGRRAAGGLGAGVGAGGSAADVAAAAAADAAASSAAAAAAADERHRLSSHGVFEGNARRRRRRTDAGDAARPPLDSDESDPDDSDEGNGAGLFTGSGLVRGLVRRGGGEGAPIARSGRAGSPLLTWSYFVRADTDCAWQQTRRWECALCGLACNSARGLHEHLDRSHDMVMAVVNDGVLAADDGVLAADGAVGGGGGGGGGDVPPHQPAVAHVDVRVLRRTYDADNQFQMEEADAYRLGAPEAKEFSLVVGRSAADQAAAAGWRAPARYPPTRRRDDAVRLPAAAVRSPAASTAAAVGRKRPPPEAGWTIRPAHGGGRASEGGGGPGGARPPPGAIPPHLRVTDPAATAREVLARTSFFHARTARRMTEAEVIAILADPRGAPDSDDEEDADDARERMRRALVGGGPSGATAPRHPALASMNNAQLEMMFNWNLHLGMGRGAAVPPDSAMPAIARAFSRSNAPAIAHSADLRAAFADLLFCLVGNALISRDDCAECLGFLDPHLPPRAAVDMGGGGGGEGGGGGREASQAAAAPSPAAGAPSPPPAAAAAKAPPAEPAPAPAAAPRPPPGPSAITVQSGSSTEAEEEGGGQGGTSARRTRAAPPTDDGGGTPPISVSSGSATTSGATTSPSGGEGMDEEEGGVARPVVARGDEDGGGDVPMEGAGMYDDTDDGGESGGL